MKRIIALLIAALIVVSAFAIACSAEQTGAYKLGDADGSSEVDSVDVTVVQRVLILVTKDEDGMIAMRADVNGDGLDAVDATFIQRYCVNVRTPYDIGEWVYTEQPTQAPTQKPTRDEYELPFVPAR